MIEIKNLSKTYPLELASRTDLLLTFMLIYDIMKELGYFNIKPKPTSRRLINKSIYLRLKMPEL